MFVSSVVPVWTLRRATWSWTAGNKISPPPSSASPRRPPTRLTRASPPRPPPYPASCATPGPPPTPTTLSRSPPYNLRPRPRLPPEHRPRRPTSQPPHELWTTFELLILNPGPCKPRSRGQIRLRRILWVPLVSLTPLTMLWITRKNINWEKLASMGDDWSCEIKQKSNPLKRNDNFLTTVPRPSCILDPNMHFPPCTLLTFWIWLHKPQAGSSWSNKGKNAKTPKERHSAPREQPTALLFRWVCFCVRLEEQRICGEQRLTIQCKAADGLCDLIEKGIWRTAGLWRIIRLSWFSANSSVTDALCWQPNNPHGHGDDSLIIIVDGCCCWWWRSGQHCSNTHRKDFDSKVSFLYRNRLIAAWRRSAECRVGPLLFEMWRLWRDFKMKSRFGIRKDDLVTDSSLQVTF